MPHSQIPFSGDLTGVLRETPVAPVGRIGDDTILVTPTDAEILSTGLLPKEVTSYCR